MASTTLDQALERYETALVELQAQTPLSPEQVLAVLKARDRLQVLLADKTQDPIDGLLRVIRLDDQLINQAGQITRAVKLAKWRESLRPSAEAWWWSLEKLVPPHWADRFDGLIAALTIAILTIALSLAVDISQRFLRGGPDFFSALAVVSQAVVTLFAAGGALTKAGQEVLDRILNRLPSLIRAEARLVIALTPLLLTGLLWLSLPRIAIAYNEAGRSYHSIGDLTNAQYNYQRAINLYPDYREAHYNLGLLYEDLFDFEAAKREYQIAVRSKLDAAYNNLARLYILEGEYSQAAAFLSEGLPFAEDNEVAYDMRKNLGWARVEQGRFDEAQGYLEEAIALKSERAPAYCLLALVLEGQGDSVSALPEWERCSTYAIVTIPEEDVWLGMARQRLDTEGNK